MYSYAAVSGLGCRIDMRGEDRIQVGMFSYVSLQRPDW